MRTFVVEIVMLQHLEDPIVSRRVVFWIHNVETAIHFASIDLAEGEYVSHVWINLFGWKYIVWDYLKGKRQTRLKI